MSVRPNKMTIANRIDIGLKSFALPKTKVKKRYLSDCEMFWSSGVRADAKKKMFYNLNMLSEQSLCLICEIRVVCPCLIQNVS